MLFHERAKIAQKALAEQPEYTYQEMLEIQKRVKAQSKSTNRKTGITVEEEKPRYNPKTEKTIADAKEGKGLTEITLTEFKKQLYPKAKAKAKTKKSVKKVKEEKSPYNPSFVKKILRSEKSKNRTEVKDVNDLWGSLGIKKKTPVKKAKK